VAILDPQHLLDQAHALLAETDAGPRCQVDLRRAISAAYYSVFHTLTCAAADRIVGSANRSTPGYTLVYRAIDHRALNSLCLMATRPILPPKYQACCPHGGFGDDIRQFCRSVSDLQQQRNTADYDPGLTVEASDARGWVIVAGTAIRHWASSAIDERDAFLLLLLFPPR
jgi:hypothetical protein